MFIALVTTLALAGGTSSAPASASGTAPSSTAAPLREVVYKVSFTLRQRFSNESYGGSVQDTGVNSNVVQAPPFAETANDVTDNGTVTVDVMQVAGDQLGMRVTEHWTGATPSATYLGNVGSDGSVNFRDSQMNECTRALLEYFGPAVMAGQSANSGAAWERSATGKDADIDTTYTINAVTGAIASIHEQTTVKSKSIAVIDSVVNSDVQYKPATLAPISGRIVMHGSRSSGSSVTNVTTIANFDRVSDSRDPGS
jgi:hypothetical protein